MKKWKGICLGKFIESHRLPTARNARNGPPKRGITSRCFKGESEVG